MLHWFSLYTIISTELNIVAGIGIAAAICGIFTELSYVVKRKNRASVLTIVLCALQINSRFICLDTHDLQNASDNVKRTQYLNLLSWCWEEMSRDRNERCLLVCDEAYLMIDPQVPQSLVFLRNVEKRARKYEAGLAIISHSVVDFLAPEVKMYGQALLDIPCYKILMGCDGKNLQETKDLYNLTDAEQELLESKRRGHALFIIGSKRLHVNFEIPAYKFSYMGKAGGR